MALMEIILLEPNPRLGKLGDLVKVKKGFARNFLFPNKKACKATKEAIKSFELMRADLQKIAEEKLEAAKQIQQKLEGLTVQIVERAGVDGRLFGSVTHNHIIDALVEHGFSIKKTQLSHEMIKTIGDFPVKVHLHHEVNCQFIVSVLGGQHVNKK